MASHGQRRDSKHRVLRRGESIRADGKYQFKYQLDTRTGYTFVQNLMENEEFYSRRIVTVKVSDAKIFLIKLQEDGRGSSTIKTVRGVLRPAFQMAVDDDILTKNPFGFQLEGIIVNTEHTRQAITRDQMQKFLKFVHDDNVYCKYYEAFYILFHTGLRISEFCGLTIRDIDLDKNIIDVNHQLQRTSNSEYIIETTKTNAGTRKLPITEDVADMFRAVPEDRPTDLPERMVDGYTGCRCPTSLRTSVVTPTAATWQKPE